VPLQPGVNHVVWCKQMLGIMNISFSPHCDDDWPTISPHPVNVEHALQFYFLRSDSHVNHFRYRRLPRSHRSSHPLSACKRPPAIAVYSHRGTVPSLMRATLLVVISQGYLLPDVLLGQAVPHRIVDETYHCLRIAGSCGTVIH
jgi:hypothetical protein